VLQSVGTPTINRRTLIKDVAIGATGSLAGGYIWDAWRRETDVEKQAREMRFSAEPKLRDVEVLFAEAFRLNGRTTQALSPGRRTYNSRTGFHADNVAAARALSGPLGHLEFMDLNPTDGTIDAMPAGDIILLGGPNSTPWTRIAWEFEGDTDYTQRRRQNALLPLKYYGISDPSDPLLKLSESQILEEVGWHMEGVGPIAASNWPFVRVDHRTGEHTLIQPTSDVGRLVRAKDRHGNFKLVPQLTQNYLLVTRIPNFPSERFEQVLLDRDEWSYLIVFEGNHGIGTRALELLLQSQAYNDLLSLHEALGKSVAFQALFELGALETSPGGFQKFYAISLVDIVRLDLPDELLLQAHKYVMEKRIISLPFTVGSSAG
jgi:hypothetical protein